MFRSSRSRLASVCRNMNRCVVWRGDFYCVFRIEDSEANRYFLPSIAMRGAFCSLWRFGATLTREHFAIKPSNACVEFCRPFDFKPLGLVAVLSFLSQLSLTVGDGSLIHCYGESYVFITFFHLPLLITTCNEMPTNQSYRLEWAEAKSRGSTPGSIFRKF